MKLIEGSIENLPATVHVEQDGNWFFICSENRDNNETYVPPLAVIGLDMFVGFDPTSGKAAQDVIRAFLSFKNINATFDY